MAELELLIAPYGLNEQGEANVPNPTQQKVLDWVDQVRKQKPKTSSEGIPVLYLQGGVGSGKTRGILAPVTEMLFEIPGLRILWGRQDFKDLKLSAMETFFEVMPLELVGQKSEQYHWYDIKQPKGKTSRIYFNGLKDLGGLGSQEFAIIVVTEAHEISEKAYRTLKQRVRQAHMPTMILMEGNPPNKDHWLCKLIDPKNKLHDRDIEMWEVSTYENWKNLPTPYRNSLENMPQSWKNKYLYGHFGFTPDGSPFYEGFDERFHKRELQWMSARPIIRSWDYGFRHPACSFHQIDAKGRWVVIREVMGTDITIDKFGQYIKTMCTEWYPGFTNYDDVGDPAGTQKSDKSEKTSVEILNSMGIFPHSKGSTYRERKEIIERKLSTLIDSLPALIVDQTCLVIVDGFLGGYHYPVRKEGQAFNPNRFEIPFQDGYYEHLMNTLEYFAVNFFTGAETKEEPANITYKVVGPTKDVHYNIEEDERTNHGRYRRASQGVIVEG